MSDVLQIIHDQYADAPAGFCAVTNDRHLPLDRSVLMFAEDDKRRIEVLVCRACSCLYYRSEPKIPDAAEPTDSGGTRIGQCNASAD